MIGRRLTTRSRWSRTLRRRTPWIAGCRGPKPSSISSPRSLNPSPSLLASRRGAEPLDGEVLAQRMALEPFPKQDAGEIRMAVEAEAEEVPHLALAGLGGAPDRGDGRDRRLLAGRDLEAQPPLRRRIQNMVGDLEAGLPAGEVDATEVDQDGEHVLVFERRADLRDRLAPHAEGRHVCRGLDGVAEPRERFQQRIPGGLRLAHTGASGRPILASSSRRPASSASGLGGQPGTWTSIGITPSSPRVTA